MQRLPRANFGCQLIQEDSIILPILDVTGEICDPANISILDIDRVFLRPHALTVFPI